MQQQTYTELTREENAIRDRARRYEAALNALNIARERVQSIEAKVATPDEGLAALEEMHRLAAKIPTNIGASDSLGRYIPGGYEIRGLVIALVAQALGRVAKKRRELEERAVACRETLAKAEAAMREFED